MKQKFIILKFGGSSIKNAKRIKHVAEIIHQQQQKCDKIAIVVSALGGVTDKLIKLSEFQNKPNQFQELVSEIKTHHFQICKDLKLDNIKIEKLFLDLKMEKQGLKSILQFKDKLISYGERISSQIISDYLHTINVNSESLDARKVIITDNHFGNAFVHYQESYKKIRTYFSSVNQIQVITGFIGSTQTGETTTLGRSGSDYTASIFGSALNVDEIQIWTDVNGILSANPKIVKKAKPISHLNYEEAMELAHAGAKVIFPPTMVPALDKNIPIRIKNTFRPEKPGSLISNNFEFNNRVAVGISSQSNMAMVRLQGAGMVGLYGLIGRIFSSLAKKKVNIVLVSQVFSEHSICFVIQPEQIEITDKTLKLEFEFELKNHIIDRIIIEKKLSLIALVGEGMRQKFGISGRLFDTLGHHKISVVAIAQGSSERNISLIVNDNQSEKTLHILHSEFFEKKLNNIGIFLAGVGTVGNEFLHILSKISNPKLILAGVLRSKKILLYQDGINPIDAITQLEKNGETLDFNKIFEIGDLFKNKIFIDCTTSQSLSKLYPEIFNNGFSIVTANKKANTLGMEYYNQIHSIVKNNPIKFYYETNVGAGLPVISTIKSLLASGDKIHKIEGILSGTLSYLFNSFDGQIPFSELVKRAKINGYTEPDPREDLNGMDVARKLLILARELGYKMELNEINVESLLPEKSDECKSIDEFLNFFNIADSHFNELVINANANNQKLKYIGLLDGKSAQVKLEAVSKSHPFYHLDGSENIISITTTRYSEKPLVIRGHGAGAEVTAGGVMADLMEIIKEYE